MRNRTGIIQIEKKKKKRIEDNSLISKRPDTSDLNETEILNPGGSRKRKKETSRKQKSPERKKKRRNLKARATSAQNANIVTAHNEQFVSRPHCSLPEPICLRGNVSFIFFISLSLSLSPYSLLFLTKKKSFPNTALDAVSSSIES